MAAVTYHDGDTTLHGELFRSRPGLPGILLVHGGAGLDEHARSQARRWSAAGYTVFACDMFGEGVAGDRERVIACLTRLRDDPDHLVRRASAGLDALREHGETAGPAAAVGYCFGGLAALTLARAGAGIAAAVSIHGSLSTPTPARAVPAKVLVCHGSADPHVPAEQVTAFTREMDDANADWQLNIYGGAMHGFTHTTPTPVPGVAFHPEADRRSFADAARFLADLR
jgi:dienelactone hydrolase